MVGEQHGRNSGSGFPDPSLPVGQAFEQPVQVADGAGSNQESDNVSVFTGDIDLPARRHHHPGDVVPQNGKGAINGTS